MGKIEDRVQQLYASVEELRVLAEMDKIRYEESSKFLSLLQQSLGEDNKLPHSDQRGADQLDGPAVLFGLDLDHRKGALSLGGVPPPVSPSPWCAP